MLAVPPGGGGGGATEFVWTGDRWQQAPDGVKGHEGQFWAPLRFAADGSLRDVAWLDSFDLVVPEAAGGGLVEASSSSALALAH